MRNCGREATCLGARGGRVVPWVSLFTFRRTTARGGLLTAQQQAFLFWQVRWKWMTPVTILCLLPTPQPWASPSTHLSPKSESSSLPSQLQNSCTFCIPFFDIVLSQCFKWHAIKEKNSKKFPVNKLDAVQSYFPFWGQGWIEETDTTHWSNIQFLSLRFKIFWESNT